MLSPKAEFQRHEEISRQLATVVRSENFAFSASMALAEFVVRDNPTQEQLTGAKRFLEILTNLPEINAAPAQFPVRRINHDAFEQTTKQPQ